MRVDASRQTYSRNLGTEIWMVVKVTMVARVLDQG